jgi:hypothetical protein
MAVRGALGGVEAVAMVGIGQFCLYTVFLSSILGKGKLLD